MRVYLLISLLLVSGLSACVTSPTGRSQLMVVSDSQMSQMGLTAFNDMRKQGKFVDLPRERSYATCVSRALIAVLPPPWNTQQWEVQIVGDDNANAFALPGGRIGVNKGMFKVATDQDQLAVVLGHELAHVVSRHGAERVSDNLATQMAVAAGSAYAGSRRLYGRRTRPGGTSRHPAAVFADPGKRGRYAGPALHGASRFRPTRGGDPVAENGPARRQQATGVPVDPSLLQRPRTDPGAAGTGTAAGISTGAQQWARANVPSVTGTPADIGT